MKWNRIDLFSRGQAALAFVGCLGISMCFLNAPVSADFPESKATPSRTTATARPTPAATPSLTSTTTPVATSTPTWFPTAIPTATPVSLGSPGATQMPIPGAPLVFEAYALDFSRAARLEPPMDPQVFVQDPTSGAGTGPQQISHAAGLRNAGIADPAGARAYDAGGGSLGFTLGEWFAAQGGANIVHLAGGSDRVTVSLRHLIAFGVYSLFEVTYASDGPIARPLDGNGNSSSFTATVDGTATVIVDSPRVLTGSDAIVLVYHSDATDHGLAAGTPGSDAHVQLIVRVVPLPPS